MVLLIGVIVGAVFLLIKRKKSSIEKEPITSKDSQSYIVLQKDANLKSQIDSFAENIDNISLEFKYIENMSNAVIDRTDEATDEINIKHNRYKDIGKTFNST